MLALVNYSWHFRHYLYGRKFIARTDHDTLRWLTNFKEPSGQIVRWLERLAEFDFKVHARPGKRHGNADRLSRRPPDVDGVRSELPAVGTITEEDSSNWCRKWSPTELRHVQLNDPTVGPVLVWREQKSEPPTQNELQGTGPSVRKLCSHWDSLEVQDGVLYRRWEDDNGASTRLLLVVPRALVPEVLSTCHNSPTAGHLGVTKTVGRVQERFYWPGQHSDVEDWIQCCERCSTGKARKAGPRAPLVSCLPGYPLERVAIDILGPLPETERRNKYIMVVADYFSKWTESYPPPNQEAWTVAQKLVDEFICRFGAPEIIHTDQGCNFESSLFQEMCDLLGVKKTRTTPYHPEGDGMVERFNRTLEAMLSKFISQHQKHWDVHLPKVMMAYRSSDHASTKFPPFRLMFGRDVRLPLDVMFGRTPDPCDNYGKYVGELRTVLEEARELARIHLAAAQHRQKEYYERRAAGQPYTVGERVWLFHPALKKGQSSKLSSPWKGPFVVVDRMSDVTYRIQPEGGPASKRQIVHFNRLKICRTLRVEDDSANPSESKMGPPEQRLDAGCQYVPDDTDLMYAGDQPLIAYDVPRAGDPIPLLDPEPPPPDEGRRERRPPAWTRDYILE